MGLFKRKDSNCWQTCFFLEGRKVRKSTRTTNKKIAQRIYDRIRGQIAEGTYDRQLKADMPFFQLVDEFLEKHSKVEKASYKRDVISGRLLKKYFGRMLIGEINAYEIKEWRQWRLQHTTNRNTPVKKATVNRDLAFLKTMFNMAVQWGWLRENPAKKIKLLRGEEKRLRILDKDEISKLIKNASEHLKPILITAVSTGMRRGEILNLKWKHVDFSTGFIRVENSKNGEARNIPLNPYLKDTLMKLMTGRNPEDYVFIRKDGKRITCFKEAFKVACSKAGITDFRFHDTRHVAASLLAAGGCDIITLQYILGHKTLAMTQRYAHLIPGKHQKPREIMQDFWKDLGDTKSDTVSYGGKESCVSH
jgi:integrase